MKNVYPAGNFLLQGTNVAYLKPATQNNDETYEGWNWTAAYAVEGCTDRDNLVGQTCCSSAVPSGQEQDTYWSVDLLGLYIIDLIIIFGRSGIFVMLLLLFSLKWDFSLRNKITKGYFKIMLLPTLTK